MLTENLNYSAQGLANTWKRFQHDRRARRSAYPAGISIQRQPPIIANIVYGNRLGNTDPNDGWTYRGRGLIQVTGKDNYQALADAWAWIASPTGLSGIARGRRCIGLLVRKSNGCNELAQAGDWLALRKRVNGGTVGINEVNALIQTALRALGVQ